MGGTKKPKGKNDSTSSHKQAKQVDPALASAGHLALQSTEIISIPNLTPHPTRPSFTVASWNVLADDHTYPHYYRQLSKQELAWSSRFPLLMRRVEALRPDLLCMQEVDHWPDFDSHLQKLGYANHYLARGGTKQDGCALCYDPNKFYLIRTLEIRFNDLEAYDTQNSQRINKHCVALGLVLRPLDASNPETEDQNDFLIVTTHLFWNPKYEDVKVRQIVYLLQMIAQSWNRPDKLILCGDLNSTPDSAIGNFLRTGSTDLRTWKIRRIAGERQGGKCDGWGYFGLSLDIPPAETAVPPLVASTFPNGNDSIDIGGLLKDPHLTHPFTFTSAYRTFELLMKNSKSSSAESSNHTSSSSLSIESQIEAGLFEPITSHFAQFSGCLDYILFTPGIHLNGILRIPTQAEIEALGYLPTVEFASDHVILMASFSFD